MTYFFTKHPHIVLMQMMEVKDAMELHLNLNTQMKSKSTNQIKLCQ